MVAGEECYVVDLLGRVQKQPRASTSFSTLVGLVNPEPFFGRAWSEIRTFTEQGKHQRPLKLLLFYINLKLKQLWMNFHKNMVICSSSPLQNHSNLFCWQK